VAVETSCLQGVADACWLIGDQLEKRGTYEVAAHAYDQGCFERIDDYDSQLVEIETDPAAACDSLLNLFHRQLVDANGREDEVEARRDQTTQKELSDYDKIDARNQEEQERRHEQLQHDLDSLGYHPEEVQATIAGVQQTQQTYQRMHEQITANHTRQTGPADAREGRVHVHGTTDDDAHDQTEDASSSDTRRRTSSSGPATSGASTATGQRKNCPYPEQAVDAVIGPLGQAELEDDDLAIKLIQLRRECFDSDDKPTPGPACNEARQRCIAARTLHDEHAKLHDNSRDSSSPQEYEASNKRSEVARQHGKIAIEWQSWRSWAAGLSQQCER